MSRLEKYLDDRETWQNNTIEEIKKKVIYKPKSLKNSRVGEKLVAIYGPPQIGKTTLILCLIGIAPEFQKKVYNDIRAGVPRGNSSTSTAIIYHQIDADLYGVKYGDCCWGAYFRHKCNNFNNDADFLGLIGSD